jgi:galactonate dehydratase|eukprot:COSAG06_NODE_14143_length_1184_cov_1.718894_2_plen_104_part_00
MTADPPCQLLHEQWLTATAAAVQVFVKITCSNGTVGWGEASYGGRDRAAGVAVEEAARYLLGTDPMELERHMQHLYRGPFRRGGPVLMSASAGIDMALCKQPG